MKILQIVVKHAIIVVELVLDLVLVTVYLARV